MCPFTLFGGAMKPHPDRMHELEYHNIQRNDASDCLLLQEAEEACLNQAN